VALRRFDFKRQQNGGIVVWIWDRATKNAHFGAEIDYKASAPMTSVEYFSDVPVDPTLRPVFRSRSPVKRFKKYHSPPIGTARVVDEAWKKIILEFVPEDRVQFLPIRLIAQKEICDDFMWVIPFDRVTSVDLEKSIITRKRITISGKLAIFGFNRIVLKPECLGPLHLARDEQLSTLLLVSDALKDALTDTGDMGNFIQPEDLMTLEKLFGGPTPHNVH
jgi:hypothetical protein